MAARGKKIKDLPSKRVIVSAATNSIKVLAEKIHAVTGRVAHEEQIKQPVFSTGCLPLNWAIGRIDPVHGNAGIPKHSCVETYGPPGVGKSTLLAQHMAQIHKADETAWCAVLYSEEPWLDVVWQAGVDPDRIIVIDSWHQKKNLDAKYSFAEQRLTDLVTSSEDPHVYLIGIDSVKAVISSSQVYEKGDLKKKALRGFDKADPVARRAQLMEKFFNDIKTVDTDATIFMTNQASEIIDDPTKPPEMGARVRRKTPAGRRKEFEALLRIELASKPLEEGEDRHELYNFKPGRGLEIHAKVWKNRYSPLQGYRHVQSDYYFELAAFDCASDILAAGVYVGVIKRKGNYFEFPTSKKHKVLGKDKAAALLYSHPALMYKLDVEIAKRHRKLFSLGKEKSERLKAAYSLFKTVSEDL